MSERDMLAIRLNTLRNALRSGGYSTGRLTQMTLDVLDAILAHMSAAEAERALLIAVAESMRLRLEGSEDTGYTQLCDALVAVKDFACEKEP